MERQWTAFAAKGKAEDEITLGKDKIIHEMVWLVQRKYLFEQNQEIVVAFSYVQKRCNHEKCNYEECANMNVRIWMFEYGKELGEKIWKN